MRDYGQIQCAIWTHPDFVDLSDQGKVLMCYLLTGQHSNGLGCYRMPVGYIMADLGWTQEKGLKTLSELFENGFINRCERTDFVWIPKYLRWNPVANSNVAKAREKEFQQIPSKFFYFCSLASDLLEHGQHWAEPFRNRLETLSKGYAKQEPNQNLTEPERNREENSAEPQSDSTPVTGSPPVIHLPLNDSTEHPITVAQRDEWQALYPAVDVDQALRSMRAWCLENSGRRKTRRGIGRFVIAWLERDQNSGGNTKAQRFPVNRQQALEDRNREVARAWANEKRKEAGNA